MSFLILMARKQTLVRAIEKGNAQLSRLKDTNDLTQAQMTNSNRLKTILYAINNGASAYANADFNNELATLSQEQEALLYMLDEKADSIELETSMLNSLLKSQTEELKNIDNAIKEEAKKEAPKYTMG